AAHAAVQFHGHLVGAPRLQKVERLPWRPLMPALRIRPKCPVPVALSGVAGAGDEQQIAGTVAAADRVSKGLVYRTAAVAIAPARHDHGTTDDARPLPLGPAHGCQKCLRLIRLPVREDQPRARGQCVQDLATQDAVLAGPGLEVAIAAKGLRE